MNTTCVVDFDDNLSKVVYSGQTINGNIKLNLAKEERVRGVFIKFSGKGRVEWDQGKATYKAKEIYFKDREYFIGGANGDIRLAPGSYNHTFNYTLPFSIPSSICGEYGSVRYLVSVVLDMPWQQDRKFEFPFTVIQPVDLNQFPTLKSPVNAEKEHTFFAYYFLCCCPSEPLILRAQLPVGGYIPGQTIDLKFDAINKSNVRVSEFEIQFVRQITYSTKNKICRPAPKLETIVVYFEKRPGSDPNNEKCYQVNFIVPAIVPTSTSSEIIKVEFFIRIVGSVSGLRRNVIFDIPIMIGSCAFSDN